MTYLVSRCGPSFNSSIGFCLPALPKPVPALVCQRPVPTCASLLSPTDCTGGGNCKWVPTGPPLSPSGLCVYDWDKCKAPADDVPVAALALKRMEARAAAAAAAADAAAAAAAAALAAPAPPAPAAKLACNLTTAAECDARACCQWCGPVAATVLPVGFCMPVLQWPAPALTCSKGPGNCAAGSVSAAACAATGAACSWHPYGPPGSPGPGVCAFDWDKCIATA
jgi:hypothetical protein